jgi:murein DD-endopeptidase MepM/ murein hydrolase activator NlpD
LCLAGCAPSTSGDLTAGDPAVPISETEPTGPRFGFPVPDRDLISTRIGVDHDPTIESGTALSSAICTDYLGRAFPHCYDQHDGSDFMLAGGFETMDAGSTEIVAAASGVVVETHDGEYDHCHIAGTDISCDGNSGVANYVKIEHPGGWQSWYWHMMKGSVAVAVGDEVACGDPIGIIGSSGYSSAPHVHFEVQNAEGAVIDPYAGPFSQDESFWEDQRTDAEFPGPGCTAR